MHYTDNNVTNQPNFYTYNVTMENYYPPFSGLMLGTTDKIKTNDCKTLSAFYADGTIHFVFETRGDDFHTKVNYCRLNTADLTQKTLQFGLQPFEYAFPSVAPFSASNTDKSVLIGFLRTGGSIYPEFRVAAVDHDMNYSGSVLVKEGESFVDHDAGALERWGDYTGISRRHSANGVEIWVSGSYGEDNDNGSSNVLGTWIAQVTNGQIQAPVADFTSDVLNVSSGEAVNYMDMSINAPTSWQWTFEGGLPSTSTLQNPVIIYAEPGCYDVTLTASNAGGNNTMTKPCYIDVLTAVAEPDMVFNKFTVFPNPVTDERLNVEFEIEEPTVLDFFVVDSRGRVIKNILCRRVKGGLNTIAFNTDLLAPGAYYIAVRNAQNHLIKTEKFIVAQ
jgi:PKD repeat protein